MQQSLNILRLLNPLTVSQPSVNRLLPLPSSYLPENTKQVVLSSIRLRTGTKPALALHDETGEEQTGYLYWTKVQYTSLPIFSRRIVRLRERFRNREQKV